MIKQFVNLMKPKNVFVYRNALPRGNDLVFDLNRDAIIASDGGVVLDIGANIGVTIDMWKRAWPNSTVFAYEPTKSTYEQLKKRCRKYSRVTCVQKGISNSVGKMRISIQESSTWNRIVGTEYDGNTEEVTVSTIDAECDANGLDSIDLLKIDVEGHEFAVLQGAKNTLLDRRIGLIYIELASDHAKSYHEKFSRVDPLLRDYGFATLAMYDQTVAGENAEDGRYMHHANYLYALQK